MVAACLAVVLSACSDNSPPDDDTRTPPATSTSSTTWTPPPRPSPPAALGADREGAEEFIRYFWGVFNYTQATGATDLLRSISDSKCTFCSSVVEQAQRSADDGSHLEGSEITVVDVAAPPLDENKSVIATAILEQAPGRVVSAEGKTVTTGEGKRNQRSDVLVQWIDGRWRMLDVSMGGPEATP
jgi:hypothetical protein